MCFAVKQSTTPDQTPTAMPQGLTKAMAIKHAALEAMASIAEQFRDADYQETWFHRSVLECCRHLGFGNISDRTAARVVEVVKEDNSYGHWNRSAQMAEVLILSGYRCEAAQIFDHYADHWRCKWDNGRCARYHLRLSSSLRESDPAAARAALSKAIKHLQGFEKDRKNARTDFNEVIPVVEALAEGGHFKKAVQWAKRAGEFEAGMMRNIAQEKLRQGVQEFGEELAASIPSKHFRYEFLLSAAAILHEKGSHELERQAIEMATSIHQEFGDRHAVHRYLELAKAWSVIEPAKARQCVELAEQRAEEIDREYRSLKDPPGHLEFDRSYSAKNVAQAYADLHLHDEAARMFERVSSFAKGEYDRQRIVEAKAEVGYIGGMPEDHPLFRTIADRALYSALLGLAASKEGDPVVAKAAFQKSVSLSAKIPRGRETVGLPWNDITEVLAQVAIGDRSDVSISSRWSSCVVAFK